ncbi:cytochrome P450 [Flagelloscypha sp. PMI_526]|nr:cytochrome P450 [Flagelloscypha sp. PMI_526]
MWTLGLLKNLAHMTMYALSLAALGAVVHLSTLDVELDFVVLPLLALHALGVIAVAGYQVISHRATTLEALSYVSRLIGCFHSGLLVSTIAHRLLFHRLRKFRGPWVAKLTRLYATWNSYPKLKFHLEVNEMHQKYGDFVRTGPRELSINRASAIPLLYGQTNHYPKGPWYGSRTTDPNQASLQTLRVPSEQKRRRRAWDRAFSIAALQSYDSQIVSKTNILITQLRSHAAFGPINVTDWISCGEIGLGKNFGAMETGKQHSVMKGIHEVMWTLGVFATAPWLVRILGAIPGAASEYMNFFHFCERQVAEKIKTVQRDSKPNDILSWLIKAEWEGDKSAPPAEALPDDARLLIIAGSDTTSTLLTNALYYLVRNPSYLSKLVASIDYAFPGGDADWTPSQLKAIPMLDDLMNEVLRLSPPVPEGLTRIIPSEGLIIDEVYIPGNTIVSVPTWTIHRDPRYWEDPDEFNPSRWSEGRLNPETHEAFVPFTRGPYACVGKQLAKTEFKVILTKLLLNFKFSLADEQNAKEFEEGQMNTFTLTIPSLYMNITPR